MLYYNNDVLKSIVSKLVYKMMQCSAKLDKCVERDEDMPRQLRMQQVSLFVATSSALISLQVS